MPKIPQNQRPVTLSSGSTGPQATPASFGGGSGMAALAKGMTDLGASATDIVRKRQLDAATDYTNQSLSELFKKFGDYVSDANNNTADDFDDAFDKFAQKEIGRHHGAAPNGFAKKLLKERSEAMYQRFLLPAMRVAEGNRITRRAQNIENQSISMAQTYRSALETMTVEEARGVLMEEYNGIQYSAQMQFENAPKVLRNLQAATAMQAGLALADEDPDGAMEIANSGMLDERQRRSLISSIESAGRQVKSERLQAWRSVENSLKTRADRYEDPMPDYPTEHFLAITGGDVGAATLLENEYNEVKQMKNIGNGFFLKSKGTSVTYKNALMAEMQALSAANSTNNAITGGVEYALQKMKLQQEESKNNPVAGQSGNPYVERQENKHDKLAEDHPDKKQSLGELYATRLRYQAQTDMDATPAEIPYYLNLPESDWRILDEKEAKLDVVNITKSGIQQAPHVINEKVDQFRGMTGDPKQDSKMFARYVNDLVVMGGLPQEWRMAFLHHNSHVQQGLIQALKNFPQNSKDAGLLPESAVLRQWQKDVEANETFAKFAQTMRPEGNRGEAMGGFRDGVIAYALTMPGSKEDKIKMSVQHLLDTKFGFGTYNGRDVMIAKWRNNGMGDRDDEEVENVVNSLTLTMDGFNMDRLRVLDNRTFESTFGLAPRNMELLRGLRTDDPVTGGSYFPDQAEAFKNPDTRIEFLADVIMERGFWRTTADGQGATLWATTDQLIPFQLRDRANQPLEIEYDNYLEQVVIPNPNFTLEATDDTRGQQAELTLPVHHPLVQDAIRQKQAVRHVRSLIWIHQEKTGFMETDELPEHMRKGPTFTPDLILPPDLKELYKPLIEEENQIPEFIKPLIEGTNLQPLP